MCGAWLEEGKTCMYRRIMPLLLPPPPPPEEQ